MSAAEKTTPLDPLIRRLGIADDYPPEHRLTFEMDAATARAFLGTLRAARRLYLLRNQTRQRVARYRSDVRIARDLRRSADDALWSDFRLWCWALVYSWLTLEVLQVLLS